MGPDVVADLDETALDDVADAQLSSWAHWKSEEGQTRPVQCAPQLRSLLRVGRLAGQRGPTWRVEMPRRNESLISSASPGARR